MTQSAMRMRAYVLEDFDAPARVIDVAVPEYAANEILVQVVGASINPVDLLIMGGFFRPMMPHRLPAVMGRDLAGTVVAAGAQVTRFRPGDRVWGFVKRDYIGDGTFAEYVACRADYFVAATPDGMSSQDAGVLGVAGVTAHECLDVVGLKPNDTVLISGATGGTGTFAVQLARARGARVLATARPGSQETQVAKIGADVVLDWTTGDLAGAVRNEAPEGVDAVIDLARPPSGDARGGESTRTVAFADFVKAVAAPGCRIASVTNGVDAELLADFRAANVHANPTPAALEALAALVSDGSVSPVVAATYDLDDLDDAYLCLGRSVTGKIAVRVGRRA